MPLPLPNLDTRRWQDLIDEGRALIPRYAPEWTDHNIHDPGITIMELMAWLTEQAIYRANRVPPAHRRKFVALLGYPLRDAQPARTVLQIVPQPGETVGRLPTGTTFAADGVRFRMLEPVDIVGAQVSSVQVDDGDRFYDRTRFYNEGMAFAALGADPRAGSALYLGFDAALPVDQWVQVFIHLGRDTGVDSADYASSLHQRDFIRNRDGVDISRHHGMRVLWEYHDGTDWQPIAEQTNHTHDLTLSGMLRLKLDAPMQSVTVNGSDAFFIRCRVVQGRPDAAPVLYDAVLNAVDVEQLRQSRMQFAIAAGVSPEGFTPEPKRYDRLDFTLDADGTITRLRATAEPDPAIPIRIYDYEAASASAAGSIIMDLQQVGTGNGRASQRFMLTSYATSGDIDVLTRESDEWHQWVRVADFDASERTDRHFVVDMQNGAVVFGDGEHGRTAPDGVPVLVRFDETRGAGGNLQRESWQLNGADDTVNSAVLGDVGAVAAAIQTIRQVISAFGGTDAETVEEAAGRAVRDLWAHERLAEFAEDRRIRTLDQQPRDEVLALAAPQRAVTLLDYERLALAVPGTQVARAVAVVNIDPERPDYHAPGTIGVVIVPHLPPQQPMPTGGLLTTICRYLHRRKVIGTRLVVTAPRYIEVTVNATLRADPNTNIERVHDDVVQALTDFLDPLIGGAQGRGYPFGRDVYRSEILQVIDNVPGVDHVLALELFQDDEPEGCLNICVGALTLVTSGDHAITVEYAQ